MCNLPHFSSFNRTFKWQKTRNASLHVNYHKNLLKKKTKTGQKIVKLMNCNSENISKIVFLLFIFAGNAAQNSKFLRKIYEMMIYSVGIQWN